MNSSQCRGSHSDSQKSTWTEHTSGLVWIEYECKHCGRLERKRK